MSVFWLTQLVYETLYCIKLRFINLLYKTVVYGTLYKYACTFGNSLHVLCDGTALEGRYRLVSLQLPLYKVCVEWLLARLGTHIMKRLNVLTDSFASKIVHAEYATKLSTTVIVHWKHRLSILRGRTGLIIIIYQFVFHILGKYVYFPQQLYYFQYNSCLLYTSPSPRDRQKSRMPSSA